MNGLTTVLAAALFVVALVWAVGAARQRAEQELLVWQALADRLGLRCASTKGPLGLLSHRLEGAREGVSLVVDTFTETDRDDDGSTRSRRYTRVVGSSPQGLGVVVDVYAEHLFSSLGKLLGAQDVTTNDEPFDGVFMVKADDEKRARRLLSPAVRSALIAVGDTVCAHYERGEIRVVWPGFERDPDVVDQLVQLVVLLGAPRDDDEIDEDGEAGDDVRPVRRRNPRRRH